MAPPINGAVSWFIIPLIGSFQPSEFIKIVLIIMISQIIQDHQARYPNPTRKDDIRLIVEISKVLLPPLVLVFLQPDAGVAIIMFVNTLVLVICSGIRKEYIWIIFILLILAVLTFFFLYFNYHLNLNYLLLISFHLKILFYFSYEINIYMFQLI
jgi:rod shape determining protein RodA